MVALVGMNARTIAATSSEEDTLIKAIYEVRDVDGTSYTGVSTLVGFYLHQENAHRAAEAVKEGDSWHSGYVIPRLLLDWDIHD